METITNLACFYVTKTTNFRLKTSNINLRKIKRVLNTPLRGDKNNEYLRSLDDMPGTSQVELFYPYNVDEKHLKPV